MGAGLFEQVGQWLLLFHPFPVDEVKVCADGFAVNFPGQADPVCYLMQRTGPPLPARSNKSLSLPFPPPETTRKWSAPGLPQAAQC